MSSPVGACAPAGDPFVSAGCLPGCPVPPPAVKPLLDRCLPVARPAAPWPRLPARLPRLPGWPAQLLLLRPEGLRRGSGSSSDRTRFRLVDPVGLRSASTAIAGCFGLSALAHVRHPFVIQRVRGFLPVLQLRLGNHGDGVTASDQLFLADRIGTSLCLTQEG